MGKFNMRQLLSVFAIAASTMATPSFAHSNLAPEKTLRPVARPTQIQSVPSIENTDAIQKEIKVGKSYDRNEIYDFLNERGMVGLGQAQTRRINLGTRIEVNGGDLFIFHAPKTGKRTIFKNFGSDKASYIGGGSFFKERVSTQNTIEAAFTDPNICGDLFQDFRTDNDLLFTGLNDHSDNGNIVMIFSDRVFNTQMIEESENKARIVSQKPDGSCKIVETLSGLKFARNVTGSGQDNRGLNLMRNGL